MIHCRFDGTAVSKPVAAKASEGVNTRPSKNRVDVISDGEDEDLSKLLKRMTVTLGYDLKTLKFCFKAR